ncbi:MAG: dipeptide epimerase [Victivallaceae bacterium]|nr:dipeptide epimerase [Victivallaceae bacterium]
MKIEKVTLARIRIPLRTPFVTALRRVEAIEDAVIVMETSEGRGYGEAPPTRAITGDTLESIDAAFHVIAPLLLGRKMEDFNDLLRTVADALPGNTSPKAAFEIALYDLRAKQMRMPLHRALGASKDRLKTDLTISIGSIDKMTGDAREAVRRGFDHLKVKVGLNAEEDVDRLTAIRDAVGGDAAISVDANQGWTPSEAISAMRALEAAGLVFDYLEQPVRSHDLEGLAKVSRSIATPVLADEAVFSPRDAINLLEADAASMINIKLMKSAGITSALMIADLAALYGRNCMMGCMLEGPVSVAAGACFAAARYNVTHFDLDGPMLAAENPVAGGTTFAGADIILPKTPGLGIEKIDGLQIIDEVGI